MPLLLAAVLIPCRPLAAQTSKPAPVAQAVETITAEDLRRHIGVIAHDSMLGRDTPSWGLELTAQYIADHFKAVGLTPAGDAGGWFQRYPISIRRLDRERSRVVFSARGREAMVDFTAAAALADGGIIRSLFLAAGGLPAPAIRGRALLVAGPHTLASVKRAAVRDEIVLYVGPANADRAVQREVLDWLFFSSKGLVVLSGMDSASFAGRLREIAPVRNGVSAAARRALAVLVQPDPMRGVLEAAGVDVARARAEGTPVIRPLEDLTVGLEVREEALDSAMVPNVVGMLQGSDPTLRREYVVLSAHMDHIGITPGQPDSINNGANDDGSGTAGILELAEAFTRPGVRPRRSLIFLAVSGEEKGLWGSGYFAEHPPVPVDRLVANINFDQVGRGHADTTVMAIGREHSDLGATLDRVAAAHPELRLSFIPDPPPMRVYTSDHYSFARIGVPFLKFGGEDHPDVHTVADSPEKIEVERAARIFRLAFHLGREVANAAPRPRWDPASYARLVPTAPSKD